MSQTPERLMNLPRYSFSIEGGVRLHGPGNEGWVRMEDVLASTSRDPHAPETPEAEPKTWRDVAHDFYNGLVGQGMAGAINYNLIERGTKGFDAPVEREAAVLPRERPEPKERERYCVNHQDQTHLAKDACPACIFNQARMMAKAADNEKAEAKFWRERAEASAGERERLRALETAVRELRDLWKNALYRCGDYHRVGVERKEVWLYPPHHEKDKQYEALLAVPAAATGGEQ